jgi:hypothetical protein
MGLSIRNSKTHFFHFSVNAAASQKAIRTKLKGTTRTKAPQHESLNHFGTLEVSLSYQTTYNFQKNSLHIYILIKF